jgi:uncharacterized membrane protein
MKWLIRSAVGLLSLIGGAALVLLAMGARNGAGRMHSVIEIAKPAEAVRPWLTEPEKLKAWVGWLLEVRREGDREIWVMEDRNNGNARMEIVAYDLRDEPGRLYSKMKVDGSFHGWQEIKFTDVGGRTRIEQTGEFEYDHWFAKLLEPIITREATKKQVEDLERLKGLVESKS